MIQTNGCLKVRCTRRIAKGCGLFQLQLDVVHSFAVIFHHEKDLFSSACATEQNAAAQVLQARPQETEDLGKGHRRLQGLGGKKSIALRKWYQN